MKRIALFLVLVILLSTALISCDRDYDEAVVKAAAAELLENSILVNEIFYGAGAPIDQNKLHLSNGYYKAVDLDYLSPIGAYNIEGLKTAAKAVYTEKMCDIIFSNCLESLRDSDGNVRYYARYNEMTVNKEKHLFVYTAATPLYENDVEYLYDTMRVVGADGEYILINIDVRVLTFDGLSRIQNCEFILLEESNGFRLDTLSFVKY